MHAETGVVELADPVQVLIDLIASTAPDAPQAAARLRSELMEGSLRTRLTTWLTAVLRQ